MGSENQTIRRHGRDDDGNYPTVEPPAILEEPHQHEKRCLVSGRNSDVVGICVARVLGSVKDSPGEPPNNGGDVDGASGNAVEQKRSDLPSTESAEAPRAQFLGVMLDSSRDSSNEGDQDEFRVDVDVGVRDGDGYFKSDREDEGDEEEEQNIPFTDCKFIGFTTDASVVPVRASPIDGDDDGNFKSDREDEGHEEEEQNIPFTDCKFIGPTTDASVVPVRASPIRSRSTVRRTVAVTATLAAVLTKADAFVGHQLPDMDVPRVATDASCLLMDVLPVVVKSMQKGHSKQRLQPGEDPGRRTFRAQIGLPFRTHEKNLEAPRDHEDSKFPRRMDCAKLLGRCFLLGIGLLPDHHLTAGEWIIQWYLLVKDAKPITRRFQQNNKKITTTTNNNNNEHGSEQQVEFVVAVGFLAIGTGLLPCQDATCYTGEWMTQLTPLVEQTQDVIFNHQLTRSPHKKHGSEPEGEGVLLLHDAAALAIALDFLLLHAAPRVDSVLPVLTWVSHALTDFPRIFESIHKHRRLRMLWANGIGRKIAFGTDLLVDPHHENLYPEVWFVQFILMVIKTQPIVRSMRLFGCIQQSQCPEECIVRLEEDCDDDDDDDDDEYDDDSEQ